MSKTILYKLFKIGKIPQNVISMTNQEGILLKEEGIGGSITYKNFCAPGKYYGLRRNWFTGSIVLTQKHFLAFKYSQTVISIPWTDQRLNNFNCFLDDNNILGIEFNASTFNQNWSGDIQLRFATPKSHGILTIIKQKIAQL